MFLCVKVDSITKQLILRRYLEMASADLNPKVGSDYIQLRCIYCTDTDRKATLKLSDRNNWFYICWKASCPCSGKGIAAEKWLKKHNFILYKDFLTKLKACEESDDKKKEEELNKLKIEAEKKIAEARQKEIEERKRKIEQDKKEVVNFYPISNGTPTCQKAIEYCERRRIPQDIWSKFYVCDLGKYANRMIIPFYTRKGICSFQGRTLVNDDIKYLTMMGQTALYNYDFLDKTKPVIVLEGPIDSMFIENATATCGAGSSENLDEKLEKLNCYYLLDNDKAGILKSIELLKEKKYVFIWKKFLKDYNVNATCVKDINDVYLKLERTTKFTFDELQEYFTNSENRFRHNYIEYYC